MGNTYTGVTFLATKDVAEKTKSIEDMDDQLADADVLVVLCERQPWIHEWASRISSHYQLPGLAYLGNTSTSLDGQRITEALQDFGSLLKRISDDPMSIPNMVSDWGISEDCPSFMPRLIEEELARPIERGLITNSFDGYPAYQDLIRFLLSHRAMLKEAADSGLHILQFWIE